MSRYFRRAASVGKIVTSFSRYVSWRPGLETIGRLRASAIFLCTRQDRAAVSTLVWLPLPAEKPGLRPMGRPSFIANGTPGWALQLMPMRPSKVEGLPCRMDANSKIC